MPGLLVRFSQGTSKGGEKYESKYDLSSLATYAFFKTKLYPRKIITHYE